MKVESMITTGMEKTDKFRSKTGEHKARYSPSPPFPLCTIHGPQSCAGSVKW
jgi:hypothetical protein